VAVKLLRSCRHWNAVWLVSSCV